MRPFPRRAAVVCVALALLAGCTSAPTTSGAEEPSRGSSGSTSRTLDERPLARPLASRTTAAARDPARRTLAGLTLSQRVGRLLMTGTPAARTDRRTLRAISRHHVGGVMLTGRSRRGVADTRRLTRRLQDRVSARSTGGVRLLIATDQEGGRVQVLGGPGFSRIPSAVRQGRASSAQVRRDSRRWARQLRRAGVTVNLAPVLDTVPRGTAYRNAPIGALGRQYGSSTTRVGTRGTAAATGMLDAGVVPVGKHFPGLGRVRGNTDDSRRVVDRRTRRGDAYLAPFRRAVRAGTPVVMMSSAVYARIDARRPAVFSPRIVGTALRRDLGFDGVVMSDDLSAARAVQGTSTGGRAVRFVRAGGDLVLAVDPADAPVMHRALLREARRSPAFRARVDAAALRVLRLERSR